MTADLSRDPEIPARCKRNLVRAGRASLLPSAGGYVDSVQALSNAGFATSRLRLGDREMTGGQLLRNLVLSPSAWCQVAPPGGREGVGS